ncbi:glycosyltransferase family 2 protein [Bacillus sp. SRB3LM]|uniref:glycosyltransferase family 2 protein n=1 Tax=Bacillus sp. SRB3LM TaxID=2608689 RepID=UPI0018C3A58A|nr:glycosyltransferase family 2 protein [Bacillus sp. SRB3LM]MBG0969467.1 glycosyltransferase family 2 protein [Bacillus sp. SRB3LM]
MCLISIVIPLYNKELYIERAIQSVLSQTIQDFEIILIDDGSNDNSVKKVKKIHDSRVQLIHQTHAGASAARNKGIHVAKADIIAFLDADDEWKPTFLETILRLVDNYPSARAYATSYEIILTNRKRLIPKIKGIPGSPWKGVIPNYFESTLGDLPIISSAIAIQKSIFKEVGNFPVRAQLGEDQDMWFRIAQKYSIAYSHTFQAIYYRGLQQSVCMNLEILDSYPIITTIQNVLKKSDPNYFFLKEYVAKLQLDFSKRLLQANQLNQAWDTIRKCRTKKFLKWKIQLFLLYWLKRLLLFKKI